jgi:hypothetical protein
MPLSYIGVAIPARLERANLRARNPVLYPIELRNQDFVDHVMSTLERAPRLLVLAPPAGIEPTRRHVRSVVPCPLGDGGGW